MDRQDVSAVRRMVISVLLVDLLMTDKGIDGTVLLKCDREVQEAKNTYAHEKHFICSKRTHGID